MTTIKAFVLGTLTGLGLAVPLALVAGIVADVSDWSSTTIDLAGMTVWAFERTGTTTSTSFGVGLIIVAALIGLLNAVASLLLRQRLDDETVGR